MSTITAPTTTRHDSTSNTEPACSSETPQRLDGLDLCRGIVLAMVLIDHIDLLVYQGGFFSKWTWMGLGFSDAAEGFVFLSGFSFGLVYTSRLAHKGFVSCQRRIIARCFSIYVAYLLTVATIVLLQYLVPAHPYMTDLHRIAEVLMASACLTYQPFAVCVLGVYIAILAWMPVLLLIGQRSWWLVFGLSFGAYVAVQCWPDLNLPSYRGDGWYFNPFAWQFLFVIGMYFGQRKRTGYSTSIPHPGWLLVAVLTLLFSFVVKKVPNEMLGDC